MKIERLLATFIDYLVISLLSCIIAVFIVGSFIVGSFIEPENSQAIPFLVIIFCFFPNWINRYVILDIYISITEGTITVKFLGELIPYISIILCIILVQTILLSLFERNGATPGKRCMNLKVICFNNKYTIGKSLCRNFIKSSSRFLFYIPFISLIFSKDNKTWYDKLLNTNVVKSR